jgi:hypothetical protein
MNTSFIFKPLILASISFVGFIFLEISHIANGSFENEVHQIEMNLILFAANVLQNKNK